MHLQVSLLAHILLMARRVMGAAQTVGELHVVDQIKYPLAAAIDGTPPVYYLRPSAVHSSASKWLIYWDGGDFCGYGNTEKEQLHDCYERAQTEYGSSKKFSQRYGRHMDLSTLWDAFDKDPAGNPLMHDWNWVYIPYLDGGYYSGARLSTPTVNGTKLHFRGSFNVEAILGELATKSNLTGATDVVFGGCSSGGVAVVAAADRLHSVVRRFTQHAKVGAFVDSGYYLWRNAEYWTKPVFAMQDEKTTLNAACVAAHPDKPWSCIVAEIVAPFVETPLFMWQSRFDENQLFDCEKLDPKNVTAVNEYGAKLLLSIRKWQTTSTHGGAFVDACSRHCGSSKGISAHGLSPKQAFAAWYKGLPQHKQSLHVQSASYPCLDCCQEDTYVRRAAVVV